MALARRPPLGGVSSITRWRRFKSNGPIMPPSEVASTSGVETAEKAKPKEKPIDFRALLTEDVSYKELHQTLEKLSEEDLETVFKNPPRLAETEEEIFGKEVILDTGRPTRLDPNSLPTPPLDPSLPCTEEQYAASLVHGRGVHIPIYHKPTYGIPVASIQFRSHHVELLDIFTHFATHAASSLGIPCSQPVYLPNKRSMWTVLKSPFAHKKSQENFERIVYKRAIKAWDADEEVVDRWFRYLRRHALGGVGMRTTKWERMSLDVGTERMLKAEKVLKWRRGEREPEGSAEKIKKLGDKIVKEELAAQASKQQALPLQN